MRRASVVLWCLLAVLWGSEWMLQAALPAEPPLHSLALRYAFAAVFLLPWALRRRLGRQPRRRLFDIALVGAGLLALPQVLLATALRGIAPAWSLLALAALPILLAVGAAEAISTAVLGFSGVLLLISPSLQIRLAETPWLLLPLAAVLLLAWTLSHAVQRLLHLPFATVLCVQCAVASCITGCAAMALERQGMDWSAAQAGASAAAALGTTVLGYWIFYRLLREAGAMRVGMLQWAQIVLGAGESIVLMHARPGWEAALGAALVCAALLRACRGSDSGRGVMLEITAHTRRD